MKLHGVKIEGPNVEEIVIPRGDTQIVFRATAVLDDQEFDDLCPRPKPRVAILKGGKRVEQTDEPTYREALNDWGRRRVAWLVLKSLEATEGLEWETVDYDDPKTWLNYEQELTASGFSDAEVARIINGVMAANGLSEAKVDEARKRFLASREAESAASSSPEGGPPTTPSGAPASA
jgi:hypothetical protein